MGLNIIGIDCATQPARTGMALGDWDGESCQILEVRKGSAANQPVEIVREWAGAGPFLLALGAPLGWPITMGEKLADHLAGRSLKADPGIFFTRASDRFVRDQIGKRPLEVGAALIARTV